MFGVYGWLQLEITYPLWEQIRENQRAFSGAFRVGTVPASVGRGAQAQRAQALWVSGEFFPVLGIVPARGRLLAPERRSPRLRRGTGGRQLRVLATLLRWPERAIGSTLTILDPPFTVVGVTPAGFAGLEVGRGFDVALPVCAAGIWGPALDQRNYWWLTVMGRLKPGWTLAQGRDHLGGLSTGMFAATLPSGYSAESSARYLEFRLTMLAAARGVSWLRSDYGTALWLLLGMTGLVLLITCGNLATLMLARASARTREMVVRVALGASRSRVVAQLLMESVLSRSQARRWPCPSRCWRAAPWWRSSTRNEPGAAHLIHRLARRVLHRGDRRLHRAAVRCGASAEGINGRAWWRDAAGVARHDDRSPACRVSTDPRGRTDRIRTRAGSVGSTLRSELPEPHHDGYRIPGERPVLRLVPISGRPVCHFRPASRFNRG